MKIIFFGSDRRFSGPVLAALIRAGHEVPVVITKGIELMESVAAESILKKKLSDRASKTLISFSLKDKINQQDNVILNYRIRDRVSGNLISREMKIVEAKTAEEISRERLESLLRSDLPGSDLRRSDLSRPDTRYQTPDTIILASFGPPFLSNELLNWPRFGALNIHASLLPRWRGASPVFASLREGDKETGVSIMRMTAEIDRGPVLGKASLTIRQPGIIRPGLRLGGGQAFSNYDTRESLTKKLGKLGGELIVDTLLKLEKGQIIETPQPKKSPTPYTRRLTKEAGRIDWSQSPIRIERFIRAAAPWPGAKTNVEWRMKNDEWKKIEVIIKKAHLSLIQHSTFNIQHSLVIDQVQLPGKNPVSWKQFLAGHPGARLG